MHPNVPNFARNGGSLANLSLVRMAYSRKPLGFQPKGFLTIFLFSHGGLWASMRLPLL